MCGAGIEMPRRRLLSFDHHKLVYWEKVEDDFDTMVSIRCTMYGEEREVFLPPPGLN